MLREVLEERCGRRLGLADVVVEISRIPYGRPGVLSPGGVLGEWRGTCSTKHMLLADVIAEGWPELDPRLWHRPYRVTPKLAARHWGQDVAAVIPPAGLVDVHTYATSVVHGRITRLDVTFPVSAWDGRSDIPLACGEGRDYAAGGDPLASKAELVSRFCDPRIRERFIAALTAAAAQ